MSVALFLSKPIERNNFVAINQVVFRQAIARAYQSEREFQSKGSVCCIEDFLMKRNFFHATYFYFETKSNPLYLSIYFSQPFNYVLSVFQYFEPLNEWENKKNYRPLQQIIPESCTTVTSCDDIFTFHENIDFPHFLFAIGPSKVMHPSGITNIEGSCNSELQQEK